MGKKAPSPPDYAAAAEQQGQSSLENIAAQTEANRPNQYTPWGSSEWQQDPQGQWTQNINLDPRQQQALDAQMNTQIARSELGSDMTGRLQQEMGQPMNWDQFGQAQQGPQGGQYGGGPIQGGIQGTNIQSDLQDRALQSNLQGTDIQQSLSNEGMQGVQGGQHYYGAAGDAIANQFAQRQEPRFEQQRESTDVRLRNQGLRPGDQAYDRAMETMQQGQDDARQMSDYQATIGSGAEAQRMQGMDMGLRGQQFGERTGMGNFANQAAGQQFGQNLGQGQFANQAQQGMFGMQSGAQQAQNQAAAMQFGQNQAQGSFGNAAQDQAFGQQLAGGSQQFQEGQSAAQFQNTQRNQAIAQEMQKRGMTLNEINAAMSGQQVGMPNMPGFSQAGAAQPTQYLGAAGMQYQGDLDQFNAQQAGTNALMGGIGDLGGAAMQFSDRRLKSDITPIGGGWYSYKLFGRIPQIGVMSDEVNPDAVVKHPSGFDMVNYGRL